MNLAWWVERAGREFGAGEALIDVRTGERVTHGELVARVDWVGAALRDRHGVQVDDVVATIMPDDPWHIATLLALMKIGAVFTGYNRTLHTGKFVEDAERSQVRAVIVGDEHAGAGEEIRSRVASVAQVIPISELVAAATADRGTVRVEPRLADDLAAVNFTGGTGGSAKGVMFTHGTLGASAQASLLYDGLTSTDVNLSFVSVYHSGGIHDAIKLVMSGMTNVLTGGWDADLAVGLIREHRPTWIYFLVATMARDLICHPEWADLDIDGLRVHMAGEVVPAHVQRAWIDKGARVMNAYGMTEAMPVGVTKTAFVYDDDRREPSGCSSRPIRDLVEVVLKDPDTGDAILTPHARGEICVRGDNITVGYHNDPERTAAAFDDEGYFHTRDLAHVDEDGWLWVQGRADDIINTGGEKLSLLEVEEALHRHDLVRDVACIGVAHERFGEVPAALVVPTARVSEAELAETLDAHCVATIERWKRPRLYGIVEEVPRTLPKRTKDLRALRGRVDGIVVGDADGVVTLSTSRAVPAQPPRA